MFRIFISASIPPPQDPICLSHPIDKQAIRDALMAAMATILPHSEIVWGGHPAITALIAGILCDIWHEKEYLMRFHLYQSEEFSGNFPKENALFSAGNIHLTPKGNDLQDSLAMMRREMLSPAAPIHMAIFMGGREEGLSKELALLRKHHPHAIVLPLASTGGYARCIYNRYAEQRPETQEDNPLPNELTNASKRYRYYTLFHEAMRLLDRRGNM